MERFPAGARAPIRPADSFALFAVLRPEERVQLERLLKAVGRNAESLSGMSPPRP